MELRLELRYGVCLTDVLGTLIIVQFLLRLGDRSEEHRLALVVADPHLHFLDLPRWVSDLAAEHCLLAGYFEAAALLHAAIMRLDWVARASPLVLNMSMSEEVALSEVNRSLEQGLCSSIAFGLLLDH
eukprot:CAMPEP_0170496836 /NCGR_PEP_ID=MMETSP0208-20121228/22847_1 /TAXON_ID=197538 /ORGANISM="Strombidium inclinatum, Strain S3" /LENGTH=127 /DNA_ID=CAMNT_0010773471 /DNA_START=309 /DNA_END=692 /DNA_ORIENTATION=-